MTTKTWRKCDHPRTPENTRRRPNPRYRSGYYETCRDCARERDRRRHYSESRRAGRARYFASERWKHLHARRDWSRVGIEPTFTMQDFQQMLAEQNGTCALCGRPPLAGRRFDADHDYRTGRVRGLVHNACNRVLGQYESGRVVTEAVAARCRRYLARFEEVAA